MPSKILLPVLAIILIASSPALPQRSGEDLVKIMYGRYHGKWYQSLTFNQTTEFYSNDSLKGTQTWYEAIVFPDQFRIDFGSKDSGNAVIFKGDSSYFFRKGQLRSVRLNDNDLIFLLGGLYFYPLEQSVQKLRALGYNIEKLHEDHWKGRPVWVIGDTGTGQKANQLWIDQENLYLVRMIEFKPTGKEEGIFDNHIFVGGGWTETKVNFYINDKLLQVELYHDCVANRPPDMKIFDPAKNTNPQISDSALVIKSIRHEFQKINANLLSFSKSTKELEGLSNEGGVVNKYYDREKKLKKIICEHYGETGRLTEEYYLKNDSLFFIYSKEEKYREPIFIQKNPKISKLTEDRFYLYNDKIILWLEDKQKVNQKEYSNKINELLGKYQVYLSM